MKQIEVDALKEKLDKIPARSIENADGRAYALIRLSTVLEIIKQMPPAQPEQRTGKWTLGFDNRYMEKYYYCSCCGGRKYGEYEPLDYFCSNCGAKMERITDA